MNIESQSRIERLAKVSRVLGWLSFLLILYPFGMFVWAQITGSQGGDFSLIGRAILAVFLMLGSLLAGAVGCVLALVARHRNKTEGEDSTIKNIANTGLLLSLLGIIAALVIFGYGLIAASNNPVPPPDAVTPKPTTSAP